MNESMNESTEVLGGGFGKNESLILGGEGHRKRGRYEFLLDMMSFHASP